MIGNKKSILEGAWQGVKKSAEVIDMRSHKGVHPRLGATDVCPFIPIRNVAMQDCIKISKKLGKRAAEELKIPVYLYEKSASRKERENLANIRKGEYEGLEDKMKKAEWKPDFGTNFNAKFGALVTGARNFLIAYNVNLNTSDIKSARLIAEQIRTSGDKSKSGRGLFEAVKAIGWYIKEYDCAQVSMNLTNYHKTLPHQVFEKISELAQNMELRVTGSEIIGLIPKEPLLAAGRYYLKKQNHDWNVSEELLIEMAVQYLGLNDVAPFKPEDKILEYKLEKI